MDLIVGILLIAVAVGTTILCIALAGFTRRLVQQNVARSAPDDDALGAGIHAWTADSAPSTSGEGSDSAANG